MKNSHKDFIHQSFAKHFRRNNFGEIRNLSEKFSQQTNRCLKQGECRFGSITMGITVVLRHLNLVSDGYCLVYGFVWQNKLLNFSTRNNVETRCLLLHCAKDLQCAPIREHGAALVDLAHAKHASQTAFVPFIRSQAPKQVPERAQLRHHP